MLNRIVATLIAILPLAAASAERIVWPELVVSGIEAPVDIGAPSDGSGRLFIVERAGRIHIHQNGSLLPTPFLDIRNSVGCCDERGLLGVAFHPQFASNGQFFVNYTDSAGDTVVSRFQVGADPNLADAASEQAILNIEQPFGNHNGGQLQFGPDAYLYIGMGDGGGAGDPLNLAQDTSSLLGKMLRIDVDGTAPYAVPSDNPFLQDQSTLDEIWALGLRNPFRYSFDRITGDLFIADVGQDLIEEVHVQRANTPGGANYGWRLMEGTQCFNPSTGCNNGSLTLPAFEYGHEAGRCSITGGFVYRGSAIKTLFGSYVYGDFCTGEIFVATENDDGSWYQEVLLATPYEISTFGQDEQGELYVADINGDVYRLIPPLLISPPSGVYLQTQVVDISLALRVSSLEALSVSASFNGGDVSSALSECLLDGTLAAGGQSFRCGGIPLNILGPGDYTLAVTLELESGISVTDEVVWQVLANTEN